MSIKLPLWLAAKATVEVGVLLPKMQGGPGDAYNYATDIYTQNFGHLFLRPSMPAFRPSGAFPHPSNQPQSSRLALLRPLLMRHLSIFSPCEQVPGFSDMTTEASLVPFNFWFLNQVTWNRERLGMGSPGQDQYISLVYRFHLANWAKS